LLPTFIQAQHGFDIFIGLQYTSVMLLCCVL